MVANSRGLSLNDKFLARQSFMFRVAEVRNSMNKTPLWPSPNHDPHRQRGTIKPDVAIAPNHIHTHKTIPRHNCYQHNYTNYNIQLSTTGSTGHPTADHLRKSKCTPLRIRSPNPPHSLQERCSGVHASES